MMYDEDLETEAIGKCVKALKPLESDARLRVIENIVKRFDLFGNFSVNTQSNANGNFKQSQETPPHLLVAQQVTAVVAENVAQLDYPTFKDVMIRGLAKTEPEILLIAVFICSNYGKEIITRVQAVKLYQDNGFYSSTRTKGFSNFLTSIIRSQYLRNVADGQYSVTSEGIEKAKEILAGKSTTVAKKISTKPKSKQPKKENKT